MKGIILAGGSGTRLYPMTTVVSKQILPVYDKPMIYYPMSVLMLAGIREILIISTQRDLPFFQALFHDGKKLGLTLSYAVQPKPNGLAEAFIIGADFIGSDNVCLVLGDNIFYGESLPSILKICISEINGATIFGYPVGDPSGYGIVEFDQFRRVTGIEEKPKNPRSNYAIPGLYFYDNEVIRIARSIKPSSRGEIEITDVNRMYLDAGLLKLELLGRGIAWLDAGTIDDLQSASNFIQAIEKRQGLKIACLEEIAYRQGYIDGTQLEAIINPLINSQYGKYLLDVLKGIIS